MNLKMHGPVKVSAEVMMTDGERQAAGKFDFPMSRYPTPSEIEEAAAQCLDTIQQQFPDADWAFFTKREMFDHMIEKTTGQSMQFALPGSTEWDAVA
jgi:hypothetical protein